MRGGSNAAAPWIEMAALPWAFFRILGDTAEGPGRKWLEDFMQIRLDRLEPVLAKTEWLVRTFSVADILMADVLRLVDRFDGLANHPACRTYTTRATARPAFKKAHADQMAHFAKADYDPSQKRFVATNQFTPKITPLNADRYLVQLKAIADNVISISDTNIGALPMIDAMPIPHRRVDPNILRRILLAIRSERGLSIFYHSMNSKRPLPLWRDITPHALAFDGLRWHVRGYCHLEARFKDFILSRILDLGAEIEPGNSASQDVHWHEFFDVVLIPNPKLAKSQRETVARDYEMTGGCLHIPVRRALLYYFNKRLRLDVADKADDPKETPVVLSNRVEFQRALKLADA